MACQIKKQNEKITEVLASNGATSILWDQLSGLTFLNDAQREDIYVNAQSIKNAVKDENGEPILMIQRTDVIHQNLGIGEVYTTDFTDAIMRNQGDTYSVGFIMSDNVEELETAEKTIPKQITDLFRKTTNSKAKVNKVKVNGIDNYVTTANVKNVFSINPNEDNTHAGFIIDKVRRGVLKLDDYGVPSQQQLPTRSSLSVGQEVIVEPRRARGTTISGKIQDILTNSETHPYGILVRLDNGTEGRVKEIIEQEVEVEEVGVNTLTVGTQIGYWTGGGTYLEGEIAEVSEEEEKGGNDYQYVLLTNGKIVEVSATDVINKPAEKSEEYIQQEIFQNEVKKLGTSKAKVSNPKAYNMAGRGRVVLNTLWELEYKDAINYIRNLKGEEKEIFETAIDYGATVYIIDYRGKFTHEITVGDGSDYYHARYMLHDDGSYSSTTGVEKRVNKYSVKPSGVISGIKKWALEYGTIPEDILSKVNERQLKARENRNKRATRPVTEAEARKFRRKAPRVLPEIAKLFDNKADGLKLATIYPKDDKYYPIMRLLLEAENSLKNVTLEWQGKRATKEGADGQFGRDNVITLNPKSYAPNNTLTHEMVHAVTAVAVDKYANTDQKGKEYLQFLENFVGKEPKNEVEKAVQNIAKLYLETIPQVEGLNIDDLNKRLTLTGSFYGFTNLHEFLAEGISDRRFQEILNNITVKDRSKTVFTRLIEVISDFLKAVSGGMVVPNSMLESLLSETENLIRLVDENQINLEGTTVQENIADYPTEGDPQQQEDTSRINAYTVKTVWNKNRNIQFTGTTKVKNAEDVAEIMKQLENKTVEHAFAVHVDEKGDSYIQFLSIGGQTGTVIDPTLVLSGVTKFKTKKVYLVHNHPSGTLQPSPADLSLTKKIREGLNPLKIDLEHVIIDTYKKSYVHIKSDNTFTVNKRGEKELKDELEVYDITDKEFISEPMGQIKSPDDVFKFIQNLRFSALPKKAVLLLDNGNNIIGNYILQKGVDLKEITDLIGEIGGVKGIILYGNYYDKEETKSLKDRLEKLDISVLDDVTVGSNGNSVVEYYVSMNSRNLLSEHQEKYRTNEVNEPFNSDYNNQQLLAPRLSREAQEQTVTIQDIGVVNGKRVIAASLAGQRVGSLTLVEQDGNFVTDTISVSEGYRGLGIAGEMYLEAANVLDRPIMSDMYRTEEAEAVWDKLFLEGKARKTSNGRYLITKEVSEVEQTQSEITEFVHSQLEKAGLVDEYYLMTNEQIESELKRRGYSDDIVRQVIAWHGSPYKFDKFTTDKIGAGEGAQAFGWGLYFTDLESIARDYAKNLADYEVKINGKTLDVNHPLFNYTQFIINNNGNVDAILNELQEIESQEKPYIKKGVNDQSFKRRRKAIEFLKNNPIIEVEGDRNLYKVTLYKGKTPITSSDFEVLGKMVIPKRPLGMSKQEYYLKARIGDIKPLKTFNSNQEAKEWLKNEDNKAEYTWLEWDKPISREKQKRINNQYEKEKLPKEVSSSMNETMRLLGEVSNFKTYRPNPIAGKTEDFYQDLVRYYLDSNVKNPQKEASLFLLRAGIDGIKYPAESIARGATSDTARGFNYVVFDENAITIEEQIQFSKTIYPTGQETFVSNALTGLDKVNQKSATPAQWVKMISDKGGKGTNQELGWIGLEDYLNEWMQENNAKSVPSEVVEQYINDNQIEIVEVSKGGVDIYAFEVNSFPNNTWWVETNMGGVSVDNAKTESDAINKATEILSKKYPKDLPQKENTKYSKYQLEGGENYREVLLTLPKKRMASQKERDAQMVINNHNALVYDRKTKLQAILDMEGISKEEQIEKMEKVQLDTYPALKESYDNLPDWVSKTDNVNQEVSIGENKKIELRQAYINERKSSYKSEHWDETNILAHLRINERTLPNGERVMFIEEVQSDWAQEGKKKGFIDEKAKARRIELAYKKMKSPLSDYVDSLRKKYGEDNAVTLSKIISKEEDAKWESLMGSKAYGLSEEEEAELAEIEKEESTKGSAIVDMPYKKTNQWAGMAMRRAMQMAAQEGFDRVAWVTGEQSAERYDLSKQIDAIEVTKDAGGYKVIGRQDGENVMTRFSDNENDLSDLIGKELANKIVNDNIPEGKTKIYEGQDLKVGGEGMKTFYNSILPKVAKKEAQRFDKNAKVEVVDFDKTTSNIERLRKLREEKESTTDNNRYKEIQNEISDILEQEKSFREAISEGNTPNKPSKQLSIAITPKMKENLSKGIPQFQIIGEEGAANLDAQEEATYRLDNLQVAREMEQAGNTPKEIRIATGWERGADSKWKYEILDGKVLIQESGEYKLEDFYDSPELYKAYPQLKNIPVQLNINDAGANNAWYNPNKNDIEINIKNESKYLLRSFLIHEIQHAVQFIELFDAGGNMEVAYKLFLENRTEEDIKKEEDLNKEIETLEKYRDIFEAFELGEYDDFLDGLTFEELFSLDFLKKSEFVNNELGDEGIKDVIEYLNNNPDFKEDMLNQFNEYEDFYFESMYAWSELLQKNKKKRSELYSPFGMYERLAGEVEARNVENRMMMSEDKRRRTTLEETEDTPREDQLNLPSEKFLEFVTSQQEGNEDVAREDRAFIESAFRVEQSVKSPITVTTNGFYINENELSKVYVNKDSNNVNGANIHEYGHAYLEQLEKTNPEIYQKGEQLIEQELGKTKSEIQDIIDFVKRNQPNLQGRALINEILTQTIQQKGEELLNSRDVTKKSLEEFDRFIDEKKGKLTPYQKEVLADKIENDRKVFSENEYNKADKGLISNKEALENINNRSRLYISLKQKVKDFSGLIGDKDADTTYHFTDYEAIVSILNDNIIEGYSDVAGVSTTTYEGFGDSVRYFGAGNVPNTFAQGGVRIDLDLQKIKEHNIKVREGSENLGTFQGEYELKIGKYEGIENISEYIKGINIDPNVLSKEQIQNIEKQANTLNIPLSYKTREQVKKSSRLADWISEFLDWLKGKLGLTQYSNQEVLAMNLSEYSEAVAVDLLRGEELFTQQQAGITIEEAIKRNNGNPLNLAPNGKPSILYKSYQDSGYEGAELDALVSQVYSDEFLGWFGDWINDPQNSSKVVDENGQPLILFHGTVDDFTVFETAPTNMKETRGGAFFGNREIASYFDGGGSGQIMPVFIKGTNPYIDSNVPNQLPATKGYWATDYFDNNLEEVYKKSQNNDSIFLQNSEDNSIFVNAFDPTQIKSATQNIGTFDSTNPDIRFQKELTLQETDYDLMIEDMIEKGEITQNCKL